MKKLLFILLFTPLFSLSQTSTMFGGNYNDNSVWTNGVPNHNSIAYFDHPITLDNSLLIGNGGEYYINDHLVYNTNESINLNGSGYLEVNSFTEINNLGIYNRAELFINCDTLVVNGNMDLTNNTYMEIADCGVLIVRGNLYIENNNTNIVNVNIYVEGDVFVSKNASVNGNGKMESDGKVEINNRGSIFGSDTPCNNNCEYGIGDGLSVSLVDFNVYVNGNIIIEWYTLSEVNNDYFLIEMGDYIDTIDGNGNSNSLKKYTTSVVKCGEYYINLYSVDFNGVKELEATGYVNKECEKDIFFDGNKFIINDKNIKSAKIVDIQGKIISNDYVINENNTYLCGYKKGLNIIYIESNSYYTKKFYIK